MTRSSTLILGSLTAILLAACGGPKHDTTTTGGTGSETGAATNAPAPADTAMTGSQAPADTAMKRDSAAH